MDHQHGSAEGWQAQPRSEAETGLPVSRTSMIVPAGRGRAYQLALEALHLIEDEGARPESEWHRNLHDALRLFGQAVDPIRKDTDHSDLPGKLLAAFDIDSIVSFSDGWHYWDSIMELVKGAPAPLPLDQKLFRGEHPLWTTYFHGIDRLAQGHTVHVANWLHDNLPTLPVRALLDLGAGPGTYAHALVENGIVQSATCVDFENVTQLAMQGRTSSLSWIAADLFQMEIEEERQFNLIYVGNVLHHYSLRDNAGLLRRVRRNMAPDGHLVVQEYLMEDAPIPSPLYAAILGIHFAITTQCGRCYSLREISGVVGASLPGLIPKATQRLGTSDLILYGPERQ